MLVQNLSLTAVLLDKALINTSDPLLLQLLIFYLRLEMCWNLVLAALAIVFLTQNRRYRWFYIIAKTIRRDLKALWIFIRLHTAMRNFKRRNATVAGVFSSLAKKHPEKIAFYFEDEVWTFHQADEFSNKIAAYFQSQSFVKGDCVALMLENRVEYVCIWLGLAKLGVVTALINTNLLGDSLVHSISVAKCKAIIFGTNHAEAIQNISHSLTSIRLYQFHETCNDVRNLLPHSVNLRKELEKVASLPLANLPRLAHTDPLIYIYTSGTTGLPKAAIVTNIRFIFCGSGPFISMNFKPDDILYVPLPLYHSAGGMLSLGITLIFGVTLAIRKKFSASNYWKDCEKYRCTHAQYIGEMCRYILAVPHKEPVNHCVKAILGSGLKPQIWNEFVQRFGIKQVFEYYGATEGISNMVNIENVVGSVGFVPRYAKIIYPVTLIKCEEDTGEPIRDEKGHCIECEVNEPGLVVAKINPREEVFTFKGYSDEKETQKKILRDVFRSRDKYFNSGDVLVSDEFGNFFFRDRTGDTFRWKGENVSTNEVEAVISSILQLNDAVVYGVEIPDVEGKTGMAAIVDNKKTVDVDVLSKGLKKKLPKYAIPLFIRIVDSVPLTSTFKLKKVELRVEGYNIDKINDTLYFYDAKLEKYVILTREIYNNIMSGVIRV